MPDIRLMPITKSGEPGESIALPSGIADVMSATVGMYQSSGFEPQWIGYLDISEGSIVGTCAFKASPTNGRAEIAYFSVWHLA
jgi:[ribosomal protein S5]-alanine N-acetyltransferase